MRLCGFSALGAQTPVDDLGLVEDEAIQCGDVTVRRGQAGGVPDAAVHVADGSTSAADQVMMVVADPRLVAGDRTGRLDTPNDASRGQGGQDVVHRLAGHLRQSESDSTENGVGVGVRMGVHRLQHCDTGTGHPQISGPQLGPHVRTPRHGPYPSPFLDRVKIGPALRWVWS